MAAILSYRSPVPLPKFQMTTILSYKSPVPLPKFQMATILIFQMAAILSYRSPAPLPTFQMAPILSYRSPVPLPKFQMTPILCYRSPVPLPKFQMALILSYRSPVPLRKFQMAPRLKIVMSSGSKKRTQIYSPFLSKSPDKRISSRFPNVAPMERGNRLQDIFTYLLIYLFISKSLRKGRPSIFPKRGPPMEEDAHSRASLNISFVVPSEGALPITWEILFCVD